MRAGSAECDVDERRVPEVRVGAGRKVFRRNDLGKLELLAYRSFGAGR